MKRRTPEHPGRGGARPGTGRPTLYGTPLVSRAVRLPAEDWDRIIALGGGNARVGLTTLLHAYDDSRVLGSKITPL